MIRLKSFMCLACVVFLPLLALLWLYQRFLNLWSEFTLLSPIAILYNFKMYLIHILCYIHCCPNVWKHFHIIILMPKMLPIFLGGQCIQ